jgi:cell division protein FtsI/penicillin-binding protein 2
MSKKNKGRHLSLRLNILFLITFLLFSALIFRLGFIQIVHGEDFRKETERNTVRKVSVEAPRGWMMDRNGEVLVNNVPVYTVTYTESKDVQQDKEAIADNLANFIDMDSERILAEMNRGIAFAPQRIKQKLTFEEVSRVSEHLNELPGVDIMVDSIRDYNYDNLFRSFIGSVRDIPRNELNYYLSRGYRMNEKVGVTYLEKQYEEQLRGTEGVIEVFVEAKTLKPISEPTLTPGQRGNDLLLTIDRSLQQAIEKSISKSKEENELVKDAYFVAMDPHTGEILGMSNDHRTIGSGQNSYAAGSTVKMATVLMGLHEGIVTPQTVIQDAPITLPGGLVKKSWRNLGQVDALEALKRSSNVYMFNIGLKLANNTGQGDRYYRKEAFDDAFYYFSQFGLGVKTGIDLPEGLTGEYEGYQSNDRRLGLLADFMIGQYHNYTPLQLAQYVSTIANGGYRMQPYLVKEIRRGVLTEEELGQVIMKREPNVLNRIDMSNEHLELVQKGMELVTEPGGTAATMFMDFPVKVAAKTGTAQTVNPDGSVGLNNTIFVGYAPAENPQIAFACIVPESQRSNSQGQIAHAQVITKEVLEVFFNVNQDEKADQEVEEIIEETEEDAD